MNRSLLNSVICGGPHSEIVCNGSCYNCYAWRKFRKLGLNVYCLIKLAVNIGKYKCRCKKKKKANNSKNKTKQKTLSLHLFYF